MHYAFPPRRWWRERTGCWHWQSRQLPVQPLTLSIHHRPFTAIEGETDDSSRFMRHIELCLSKWDLSYYRNIKQRECLCFSEYFPHEMCYVTVCSSLRDLCKTVSSGICSALHNEVSEEGSKGTESHCSPFPRNYCIIQSVSAAVCVNWADC